MYFYKMTFDEALNLSLPQMQILMTEMPKVYKFFSAAGGAAPQRGAPSNAEMLQAMR